MDAPLRVEDAANKINLTLINGTGYVFNVDGE